ncbi:PREDICTED: cyclin-C1-2-like isoform X9 [Tarenaya hassleriana]|uniref:cyclin-C1-2-like isoform X9 n=1 Tax=Tarenaya hassleriana TaxID=28532 RepID=UPI00053C757D|nr:PREDICTED: cyclin-C1-2-like isoform X9 [Tarenaya hassleriana]
MASNFWTSSHHKLLMDPEEVDVVHPLDRERGITVEDFKLIKLHMSNYISKLAQHIKIRQRVVATAITYMRRVYTRLLQDAGINDTSMTHLSCLCSKSLWTLLKWLSARTISSRRVTLNTDHNHNHRHRLALGLVNDTYRMDLILVHPPYLIALACVYIASVYKEKDIRSWLEELCVDMNVVKNIAMEILDFYENHRTITEERVHSAFSKLGKKP